MEKIDVREDCLEISGLSHFSLRKIFDCGQCFRFETSERRDPWGDELWEGVAFGKYIAFSQPDETCLRIFHATSEEYQQIWRSFLALDTDYAEIEQRLLAAKGKNALPIEALEAGRGIRILRQDPWETLCSFILSQNNNIPRIKKIIASLCRIAGEPIAGGYYRFPSAKKICHLGIDGLEPIRAGFRSAYLLDAAQKVTQGIVNLESLYQMPLDQAVESLENIRGVGKKVAMCTLLFGFQRLDAFPVDVWVKRVLEKYYSDGLDWSAFGGYAGVAQQFLFYYERWGVPS